MTPEEMMKTEAAMMAEICGEQSPIGQLWRAIEGICERLDQLRGEQDGERED